MESDLKKDIFYVLKIRCMELANSKYLLSTIKVKAILEWIIINPSLAVFIKNSISGIDYKKELERAIDNSQGIFIMPNSRRYIIAIVIGLLYEIDNDFSILTSLLTEYYQEENMEEAYKKFQEDFILPFIDAIEALYIGNKNDIITVSGEDYIEDKIISYIDYEVMARLDTLIKELNTTLKGDNNLNDYARKQAIAVVNGLHHALNKADFIMINAIHIGLKNTIEHRKYKDILKTLDKEIKIVLKDNMDLIE